VVFPGGDKADAINNNFLACHSTGMILTQPLAGMVATDAIGRWTPRLRMVFT
jgi:hypothetical protein